MSDETGDRREAHMAWTEGGNDPEIRVNLADGTARNVRLADAETFAVVPCDNCGSPNHVQQLNENEEPWIQCGCNGRRREVRLNEKGRAHLTSLREASIHAAQGGEDVIGRG